MKRARQRGIALVLVTWVFMILGVLAFDFARYMRDDAVAALNLAEETRNYYIAVAGMNRAIYELEHELDDEGATGAARGGTSGTSGTGGTGGNRQQRNMGHTKAQRDARLAPHHEPGVAACTGAACKRDADEDADEDEADDRDSSPDAGTDEEDEDEGLRSADGEWHEQELSGARYGVRVSDEGGLISLNDAASEKPPTLLRHVIKNLLGYGGTAGMDRHADAALGTVVDSIVDWHDDDDEQGNNGAESRFYLDREPSYPAKNSDFDSIEELLLVRGVTPELFYGSDGVPGLKDIFTPYIRTNGEHPKVNIRRAPAAVLQALLGIDAEEVAALIELREEQDPAVFQAQVLGDIRTLDPTLGEKTFVEGSPKVVRVEARADVSVPRNQARVAAVIELTSEITEGARIIRWFDRAPWQGGLPAGTGDKPA